MGWVGRFSRGVNCVRPWAISRCSAPLQRLSPASARECAPLACKRPTPWSWSLATASRARCGARGRSKGRWTWPHSRRRAYPLLKGILLPRLLGNPSRLPSGCDESRGRGSFPGCAWTSLTAAARSSEQSKEMVKSKPEVEARPKKPPAWWATCGYFNAKHHALRGFEPFGMRGILGPNPPGQRGEPNRSGCAVCSAPKDPESKVALRDELSSESSERGVWGEGEGLARSTCLPARSTSRSFTSRSAVFRRCRDLGCETSAIPQAVEHGPSAFRATAVP